MLFLLHYGRHRVVATPHFSAYRVQKRGERSRAGFSRGGVSLLTLKLLQGEKCLAELTWSRPGRRWIVDKFFTKLFQSS